MKYGLGQKALTISEALLDITGNALKSRDYASFRTVFHLPHTVTTFDEVRTFKTDKALQATFYKMCDQLLQLNVTDIVRQCVASEFKNPTRIESTHVANLLAKGLRVLPPYPVFSVIEVVDGTWKIMSSDYAVEPAGGLERALLYGAQTASTQTPAPGHTDNPMTRALDEQPPKTGEIT